jgi:predicted Zn-dependent protease
LNDAEVDGYLQQLAETLSGVAGGNTSVIAKALDDETPHTIALPGGYLYFSSGLLAAVASEAELAAIMAHELAHIASRHGTRPATGAVAGAAVPLIFLGGWNGICGRFARPGLYPGSYRSAAAEFEQEADAAGRELLALAGFDPDALEPAFNRLAPGNESAAAPMQPVPPADSSPAFAAVRQRVQKGISQPKDQGPRLRPIRD